MMQYLGALRGSGMLLVCDEQIGRCEYDFDAYLTRPGEVVGSGEIRMPCGQLQQAFHRRVAALRTDDGTSLGIRFSGKTPPTADAVHVDVFSGMPDAATWRRGQGR